VKASEDMTKRTTAPRLDGAQVVAYRNALQAFYASVAELREGIGSLARVRERLAAAAAAERLVIPELRAGNPLFPEDEF